jgi:hypothetical protein
MTNFSGVLHGGERGHLSQAMRDSEMPLRASEAASHRLLYVAIPRGCENNAACISRRFVEHDSNSENFDRARLAMRDNGRDGALSVRATIACQDLPSTAHDMAADRPADELPDSVRRLIEHRRAAVGPAPPYSSSTAVHVALARYRD